MPYFICFCKACCLCHSLLAPLQQLRTGSLGVRSVRLCFGDVRLLVFWPPQMRWYIASLPMLASGCRSILLLFSGNPTSLPWWGECLLKSQNLGEKVSCFVGPC